MTKRLPNGKTRPGHCVRPPPPHPPPFTPTSPTYALLSLGLLDPFPAHQLAELDQMQFA